MQAPEYHYIAYIDEAGDPGLKKVKPHDKPGSSEWLILSAVVIGALNERNVVPWVRDIIRHFKNYQRRDLHFSNLHPGHRRFVCDYIAMLPLRCFVVCSNKKNMRGYRNPFAEKFPNPNWFYRLDVAPPIGARDVLHSREIDGAARRNQKAPPRI